LDACGVHNHLASEYSEGHSLTDRLSEEEERLVVDMSKSPVRSKNIFHILKQKNKLNASTIRTVYNARKKFKVVRYAGRSQMQQLMNNLSDHAYIEVHKVVLISTL